MTEPTQTNGSDPSAHEERTAIVLIVAVMAWFLACLLAFFFVGVVTGIIVILAGVALFGWWLARLIRRSST
jgi:hypothetical protein